MQPGPALLAKIEKVRWMLRNNDCFLGQVTAQGKGVRKGKSSLLIFLAKLIDPSGFKASNIVFTPYGWNRKQNELPKGAVIGKDEPRGSQRRQWGSVENMDQLETLTEWGHNNLAGFICHPHIGGLDRAQLMLSDAWIEVEDYQNPRPGYDEPPEGHRAAVWYDVKPRTIIDEWGVPKTMPSIDRQHGVRFYFPDPSRIWPELIDEYRQRSAYYKRTGDEPDYSREMEPEAYNKLRKEYLQRRKMDRMGRAMRGRT